MRPRAGVGGALAPADSEWLLAGAAMRHGDLNDPASLARDGLRGERFDALVSCLASRTGAPHDAFAIDHRTQVDALAAARRAGVMQVVLLSPICVQKPRLAFQHAKLAFEQLLAGSGLRYSIVRPTACFKSLSGQLERVRQGKPFLVFGDGRLTACRPISDDDLVAYLADGLDDPQRANRILPTLADQAELARIGRYDADATPSTGSETLLDFFARLIGVAEAPERGDHAVC